MRRKLLDLIEYYAEADPVARSHDNGARAANFIREDLYTEGAEGDALTRLLEAAAAVLAQDPLENDGPIGDLRQCLMEWSD